MGENALRIADNTEIKIGTCESMYYLRYEDRAKVQKMPHSLDPQTCEDLFWRLPFPDEDNIRPGEYEEYNRGFRLYGVSSVSTYCDNECLGLEIDTAEPGTIQLHHKSGLLINIPCYHGRKLPEAGPGMRVFWNGKSWSLELMFIKNVAGVGVKPVVGCRHCGDMWRFDWTEIMPYIHGEMKARLQVYADIEQGRQATAA